MPLGKFTISFAELEAVRLFLEDLSFKNEKPLRKLLRSTQEQKEKVEIHIFTDSQFTLNILCSNDTNLTHFYLVEEIKKTLQQHWAISPSQYTGSPHILNTQSLVENLSEVVSVRTSLPI